MSGVTEASLTHHKMLESILLVIRNPDYSNKTLIQFYYDKKPFFLKQEVVLDIGIYRAIVSVDRRKLYDQ